MKKSKKQSKSKTILKMPVNASKFLASRALKLPKQSFNAVRSAPSQSLKIIKPVSNAAMKTSKSIANKIDSNFMTVLVVAIVAIAGLAMVFNQQDATGAALSVIKGEGFDTPPKLISDEGNFVLKGRMLFDECHLNPEKNAALFEKYPGEAFNENECCSRSCENFCLTNAESNCYKLCRVGCETESRSLFETGRVK